METVFGRLSFKLSCFPSANPTSTVAGLVYLSQITSPLFARRYTSVRGFGGCRGERRRSGRGGCLGNHPAASRAVAKFVHEARIGTWKNSF
jgi:hypothetical protein